MKKHFELIVVGRVQKVGLRFMSLKRAYELNIRGYVKYLDEIDKVGFEIEGEEENIDLFVKWLKKGASFADINSIAIQEGELKNYTTFEILQKVQDKSDNTDKKKNSLGFLNIFFW